MQTNFCAEALRSASAADLAARRAGGGAYSDGGRLEASAVISDRQSREVLLPSRLYRAAQRGINMSLYGAFCELTTLVRIV